MSIEKRETPAIDLQSDDFNSVLVCAIRYCLGRRTYMPSAVTGYIRPLLPYLPRLTLEVMLRDMQQSVDYGDEHIDQPVWMRFLGEVESELDNRG